VKQRGGIDLGSSRDRLGEMREPDQDEQDEGDRGQQRVEGERAGEEGNVVFVCGLERSAQETGGGAVPPAGPYPLQASGSS
jgi:hypothetical protein